MAANSGRQKKCTKCGRVLPVTAFHRRRHHVKSGLRAACKECTAKASKPKAVTDESRQRNAVRAKTRYLVQTGKLTPQPCKVCGSTDVQAHHVTYEGPDAATNVEWFCPLHHAGHHGVRPWTRQLELLPVQLLDRAGKQQR